MQNKKIKKLLIGTNNKGKYIEIKDLLPNYIETCSTSDFNLKSPRENGKTFLANSKLKAKYFYRNSKILSLSDDSGLSVDCLNGRPGILSARFAKKNGGFTKAMKKIIKEVKDKNKNRKNKNLKAEFVCSLSIYGKTGKFINAVGKIKGTISKKIAGDNGFGFDPIFIPNNQKLTFGQMSKRKKMRMDHRFVAYKKLKKKINFL